MRIAYVANFGAGGNRDEEAIAWALGSLGHHVACCDERVRWHARDFNGSDLVLFHKWSPPTDVLENCQAAKAFWYFDLVDFPDPELARRCAVRRAWMERVIPGVDIGFCTDGYWVYNPNLPRDMYLELDLRKKLHWLPQGFDERQQHCHCIEKDKASDVLFVGSVVKCGERRRSFLEFLRTLPVKVEWVEKNCHGSELAATVAESRIVVCPDGPISERYWSNRVYWMTGLGGFVLHPRCRFLEDQYRDGEIVFYDNRDHLHELIDLYLGHMKDRREDIAEAGRKRTLQDHTYRRRCERLIKVVEEKLACRV